MIEHTKGDWLTVFRNEISESGREMRMVYVDAPEQSRVICRVWRFPDIEEQLANARLIAAAPDLLDACNHTIDEIDCVHQAQGGCAKMGDALAAQCCVCECKAAIAKATS